VSNSEEITGRKHLSQVATDSAVAADSAVAGKMRKDSKTALQEARDQVSRTNTASLWFSRFASGTAQIVGHPYVFLLAAASLIVWALSGPAFHFSNTWQLVINTGTTIVTFLVVVLIQNTQNGDAKALHLKLDELIRSHTPARNDMIDIDREALRRGIGGVGETLCGNLPEVPR
jgi:low affinity Fe/Cu permease